MVSHASHPKNVFKNKNNGGKKSPPLPSTDTGRFYINTLYGNMRGFKEIWGKTLDLLLETKTGKDYRLKINFKSLSVREYCLKVLKSAHIKLKTWIQIVGETAKHYLHFWWHCLGIFNF